MLSADARLVAAKFARDGAARQGSRYHPLICHLLDVAAVAEALWDEVLGARTKSLLSDGLGLDAAAARAWVAFLAGVHDLGKATPVFQSKDAEGYRRLGHLGVVPPERRRDDPGHGLATASFLIGYLSGYGIAAPVARTLALVTGGHHGDFARLETVKEIGDIPSKMGENHTRPAWNLIREDLARELVEAVRLPAALPAAIPNNSGLALAGLISVVDWIGSMSDLERNGARLPWHFRFDERGADDPAAYLERTRASARAALRDLRWTRSGNEGSDERRTFGDLFPAIKAPRPLQTATIEIAAQTAAPGLVIIEAPMGEGKTEAAIYLLDVWASHGGRGAYVAMPTMATSNQMYDRFFRYLDSRFPGERVVVQKVHSGAALSNDAIERIVLVPDDDIPHDDQDMPQPGEVFDSHRDEPNAGIAAAEWFTQRKRALLAPFGVGTIDQALLAVLQTRHNFVRLFGLAGKPVLIDEVHAYDTYMSTLLERLLEWLGALRSPVVLLSATLPASRRRELVAAYQRGAGAQDPLEPGVPGPYPRITWTDGVRMHERHIEESESGRILLLRNVGDSPEAIAALLRERLAEGGCAAVICNTVARAQKTFIRLRELLPEWHDEFDLFHARFVMEDRLRIENRVLERFGPPARDQQRPHRAILVATQVIEQSLDLDFDLMISDPAPIDLLLQRSGRLMRHKGQVRMPGFASEEPTLYIRWDPGSYRAPRSTAARPPSTPSTSSCGHGANCTPATASRSRPKSKA